MHLYRACVSAHVHVQTSFNRLLDFIVLQKASIILKGPLLFHTYGKHMAPTSLFYHRMRLLPNCRVQRNLTPACNLVDRLGLLFWKEPQNWRRRRGVISWKLFTLSQMISSLGRMDCNIESITGRCSWGAFVRAAADPDGGAHICLLSTRLEDYHCNKKPGPLTAPIGVLLYGLLNAIRRFFLIKGHNQKEFEKVLYC